jgi:hypothetical protein
MNLKKMITHSGLLFALLTFLLFSCGETIYNDFSAIMEDGENAIGNTATLSLRYSNELTGDFETLTEDNGLITLNMSEQFQEKMFEMGHNPDKYYKITFKIVKFSYGTPVGDVIAIE